jgi:hypothetical protein
MESDMNWRVQAIMNAYSSHIRPLVGDGELYVRLTKGLEKVLLNIRAVENLPTDVSLLDEKIHTEKIPGLYCVNTVSFSLKNEKILTYEDLLSKLDENPHSLLELRGVGPKAYSALLDHLEEKGFKVKVPDYKNKCDMPSIRRSI